MNDTPHTPETPTGAPEGIQLIAMEPAASATNLGSGEPFWHELDLRVAAFGLDAVLDQAMQGRATPRTWLLMHEVGQPQLAVAAALGLARALAARGQAALILDGDDQATPLSRWAGREDAEGWIDIVRYGTSVLTSGVALPFDGRTAYLVGVGSYAPTDATEEEIDQLLSRLRRQADDLLVVAPAGANARVWAERSDLLLFCHDRATRTQAQVAERMEELAGLGIRPTALLGWGEPAADEADAVVNAAIEEEAPAPAAASPSAAAAPADDGEFARRRGTSGVFWLATAALIVIIAMVGVYYLKFVRVPDDVDPGRAEIARPEPTAQQTAPAVVPPDTAVQTAMADAAPADADTLVPAEPAGAGTGSPEDATATAAQTVAEAETPPPVEPEPTPAGPGFDPVPFREPVGAAGWAIHVYSLPDSATAAEQLARLERRGIVAEIRTALVKDATWYRISMGSFTDRAAARAALPGLLARLREDWGNPIRYTRTD